MVNKPSMRRRKDKKVASVRKMLQQICAYGKSIFLAETETCKDLGSVTYLILSVETRITRGTHILTLSFTFHGFTRERQIPIQSKPFTIFEFFESCGFDAPKDFDFSEKLAVALEKEGHIAIRIFPVCGAVEDVTTLKEIDFDKILRGLLK